MVARCCWTSGPGKVPWKLADVRAMAVTVKQGLPLSVAQVLGSPEWKGGDLLQLDDLVATPKAEDLVLNHCWLLPFARRFPDRIPSQFFVADTLLFMDRLFMSRLLIPLEESESKVSRATTEARKIKMLMSCLRTLWRSSTWLIVLQFSFLGWLCSFFQCCFLLLQFFNLFSCMSGFVSCGLLLSFRQGRQPSQNHRAQVLLGRFANTLPSEGMA